MLSVLWSSNIKQADNLLNVLLSAAGNVHSFILNLIQTLTLVKNMVHAQQSLTILDFTFKWLENKIDNLLAKGMNLSDFEDMRSAGLSFMNDTKNEEMHDQII